MILPGQTIGILGGGQLGRMSILAGRHMGYRFGVYEPARHTSGAAIADWQIHASYDDPASLDRFAGKIDVATVEFENICAEALARLEGQVAVHPSAQVLSICQNRLREKMFLQKHGFPHAPFREIRSADDLRAGLTALGAPAVLKTADFGYDGKGQLKIDDAGVDPAETWKRFGGGHAVLESWIDHVAEASVIVARTANGACRSYPVTENIHRNHILHSSIAPGRFTPATNSAAMDLAEALAAQLQCVGLLAVELFVLRNGGLLVNELAPRPHNSGHHTLESCQTSQFQQHIRAVCGLPLADTRLLRPAVMVNLLGDLWRPQKPPDWQALLQDPDTYLHLYAKEQPRAGRKMGHFTVLRDHVDEALQAAGTAFAALQ